MTLSKGKFQWTHRKVPRSLAQFHKEKHLTHENDEARTSHETGKVYLKLTDTKSVFHYYPLRTLEILLSQLTPTIVT